MGGQPQSQTTIVHSGLDLNAWLKRTPTVQEARPGQCPRCQRASRPLGLRLGLWGHGLRLRQQRGPLCPGGRPLTVQVALRRYRCRPCGAVVQVGPRGVLRHKHFSAAAIVLALWLLGCQGASTPQARSRVSPWSPTAERRSCSWAAPKRWLGAQQQGRLFRSVRPAPTEFSAAQRAQRVAQTAMSLAPPCCWELGPPQRAFYGGAQLT